MRISQLRLRVCIWYNLYENIIMTLEEKVKNKIGELPSESTLLFPSVPSSRAPSTRSSYDSKSFLRLARNIKNILDNETRDSDHQTDAS